MSYDLLVFNVAKAPKERSDFLQWYDGQTEWTEGHSYDDPIITTPDLKDWFMEMIDDFPPLNGPLSSDEVDNKYATDYSIGKDSIYAAFAWSLASEARVLTVELAEKFGVGFFDVSTDNGGVWITDKYGTFSCIHGVGANLD